MYDKDIEELISKTYGKPCKLSDSQIQRMVCKATISPVFMIIKTPAFRWAGFTSLVVSIVAGVLSGVNQANIAFETADIAAEGLGQIFTGLGGALFL